MPKNSIECLTCGRSWAAEIFEEQGGKVLAVSDAFGALHNPGGLDIKALREHIRAGNALDTFPGGKSPLRLDNVHQSGKSKSGS